MNYRFASSPFGDVVIATTPKGVAYLAFVENEEVALKDLQFRFPNASLEQKSDTFQRDALTVFSRRRRALPEINLDLIGTDFQLRVWNALLQIPWGQLSTYGEIAARIGHPSAHRAVGTAVGRNPIAFLVPCHRVVPASGGMGNYRWGKARKAAMINDESTR